MKLERTRLSLRLPITTINNLDTIASRTGCTRTYVIETALREFIRDLQHDVYADEFLTTIHRRSMTRTESRLLQLRLPAMYLDYLKMNQYNIAACIKTAINLYKLP